MLSSPPALSSVLSDLKKFTAQQLLDQIARERREWLLHLLERGKAAHKTRSQYQLWQEGFHPQAIVSDEMMLQKLEYIHHNPCQPHWLLTPLPEDYKWSSAMFYEKNIIEPYRWLTHYKD